MMKLIDTIEQLFTSNKKAKITLEFMSQNDSMFWDKLCSLICNDDNENDVAQKLRMAGMSIFNTFASKKIRNVEIKSLGTLDEIYGYCKRLLFCDTLRYSIKKQLYLCLRYLL